MSVITDAESMLTKQIVQVGAATPDPERFEWDADTDLSQQAFPTDCIPGAAGDMASAIAATERTPESLSGCCVLGIVSASIGAGLEVRSGAQRTTGGNTYITVSAESGTGKSETMRHASRPLLKFEAELVERWRMQTLPGLQAEQDALESELNRLKKDIGNAEAGLDRDCIRQQMEVKRARLNQLEGELQSPVLTVEDITTERLASLLSKRGECLASISPDAGAIVNNLLGRYNKLDRTDEGLYLKAFSRDPMRVDRVGRESVVLNEPCLSALWLVQPDKIESLLSERSLTEGGLIPRLLVCHSNCQPRHITGDHQTGIPSQVLTAYDHLIRSLLQTYRLGTEPHTIKPDPAAQRLLTDHHNQVVDRRLSDLKDVTTYAARWTEQAWRLSVVLHAALHGDKAHDHTLSADTSMRAINLAEWYAAQQLDILSGGRLKAQRDKRTTVLMLAAEYPEGLTARLVLRHRIVQTADESRDLLADMELKGDLSGADIIPERGGHTVRIYTRKATR